MNNKKMQWFIDKYVNGKCEYRLAETGKDKGTIVLPTGAGKSGIVYEDILWHILHQEGKIIFNLSAPILKLEAQFLNDFISIAEELLKDEINSGKFMFFVNSSADGNDYNIGSMNCDVEKFSDIEKFEKSDKAQFAFVASCHKSLYKFAEKIDYLNSFSNIATYLDEAHLILNDSRDDLSYSQLSSDGRKNWATLNELCKSDYIYALTATPDKYVTEMINKAAGEESHYNLIDVPARELIKNNIILPPKVMTRKVGDGPSEKINPTVCSEFMEFVKADNPNIPQKVLVTCHDTDHLNMLQDSLAKLGYKVFSTCARDGGREFDADTEEFKYIDAVSFINQVDSYNNDCFVLHIKQLREGIDIKTLTACIIYNNTRVNDGVKRMLVQTIGRTLRPAIGERGKCENERIKKYSYVLFLIGDTDFDVVCRQTRGFLIKYYGRDGYKSFGHDINKDYGKTGKVKGSFWGGNSHVGDAIYDTFMADIETLKVNMRKYIESNVKPRIEYLAKISGGKTERQRKLERESMYLKFGEYKANMEENYNHYDDHEYDTHVILSDAEFMKIVSDLFNEFGVE